MICVSLRSYSSAAQLISPMFHLLIILLYTYLIVQPYRPPPVYKPCHIVRVRLRPNLVESYIPLGSSSLRVIPLPVFIICLQPSLGITVPTRESPLVSYIVNLVPLWKPVCHC